MELNRNLLMYINQPCIEHSIWIILFKSFMALNDMVCVYLYIYIYIYIYKVNARN